MKRLHERVNEFLFEFEMYKIIAAAIRYSSNLCTDTNDRFAHIVARSDSWGDNRAPSFLGKDGSKDRAASSRIYTGDRARRSAR